MDNVKSLPKQTAAIVYSPLKSISDQNEFHKSRAIIYP